MQSKELHLPDLCSCLEFRSSLLVRRRLSFRCCRHRPRRNLHMHILRLTNMLVVVSTRRCTAVLSSLVHCSPVVLLVVHHRNMRRTVVLRSCPRCGRKHDLVCAYTAEMRETLLLLLGERLK